MYSTLPVYICVCVCVQCVCWKTNVNTADMLFNSTSFRKCMFTCIAWNLVVGDNIYTD